MKYPLNELSASEFEELVIFICQKILGQGTIPFSKGPDGGRDGSFVGKANCFPSKSSPWTGKIVIQAKHTSRINASCSDAKFQQIITDEIPKIVALKKRGNLDYYLLFTNRSLTGGQSEKLETRIKSETGAKNIIVGLEKIYSWLKTYPVIAKEANLKRLLLPLQFDENDLKSLVLEFKKWLPPDAVISNYVAHFKYTNMAIKNPLNALSQSYFEEVIKKNFCDFKNIKEFLENPINKDHKETYVDITDDINAKITLNRNEYDCFEEVFEYLYDYVILHHPDFKPKRLIRTFLHYMYCFCDIGKKA